ncbi:MAG: hypothetical protein E7L01_22515 [Paenibacillus macerans]|uniref:Uncharacterized protein n=1 Tax=Paenibacillus macerans TaxID=44252 RepID=A0A090ZI88_PAEMA|nr:hypothetical protein [Paenibacillus macerans]KFN10352.1 hypothetical protein DJ90_1012 [Paenibacillus macerans]MBS5910378.1 hypothetical protein [Paenibacillus macerans]MCY7557077.1 hypothetical protein [Paenibacillus macerans]MDU7476084.1 hypothetical protein [Paenibacillus macerans]MEC0139397.1 hypothetical protein [Paenibacillus macerans]
MNWATVRNKFPDQWVLLEAIEVHSTDGKRIVDRVSVINTYDEGKKALQEYKLIHKKEPNRELYVAHTSKTKKNIQSTHDPT